jgi:hypothetical protein
MRTKAGHAGQSTVQVAESHGANDARQIAAKIPDKAGALLACA